jgi:hypothetical protein
MLILTNSGLAADDSGTGSDVFCENQHFCLFSLYAVVKSSLGMLGLRPSGLQWPNRPLQC